MRKYESPDWFFFRKPYLGHKRFYDLASKDLLKCLQDPHIREIIKSSSPTLFENLNSSITREFERALFNTLSRMTFRSVPFACFAGVGIGQMRSERRSAQATEIELVDEILYKRSFRKLHSLENSSSEVRLNSSITFQEAMAKFIKLIDEKNAEKSLYQYSFVKLPKKIIPVLKDDPNDLPPKLKNHLLNLSILEAVESEGKSKPEIVSLETSSGTIHTHSIEMFIPTKRSLMSEDVSNEVLEASQCLIDIFNPPLNKLEKIKNHFIRKYEHQEVSLLELINPDNIIGKIFIQSLDSEAEVKEAEKQQKALISFLRDPEVIQSGTLKLDPEKVQRLKIPKKMELDSFVTLFETIETEDAKLIYHLKEIKGPHAIGHFCRYLHLDKNLEKNVKKIIKREEELHPEALLAEIVHRPDLYKAKNVMPPTYVYEGIIPVTTNLDSQKKTIVELSDILVFYDFSSDKFRLRSGSLNREILPVLTNLYNYEMDSHPLFKFLVYIEMQDGINSVNWNWQKIKNLTFYPRVTYKNIILSQAIWVLSRPMINELKQAKLDPEKVKEFFRTRHMPMTFELRNQVNAFRFNLDLELSLESFLEHLKDDEIYLIAEVFTPAKIFGQDDRHTHDLILPFLKKKEPISSSDHFHLRKKKAVSTSEVVFPPGSKWTYLDIYLNKSQVDSFLGDYLQKFIRKMKGKWFFVQYQDPDFHIRLRGYGPEGKKFIQFAETMFKKKICTHYSLSTYRREVERYGGLKGCEVFESLSMQDSLASLKFSEIVQKSQRRKLELWIFAALVSTEYYLKSFKETSESWISSGPTALKNGSAQRILTSYKKSMLSKNQQLPPEYHQIKEIYENRFREQEIEFKKLVRLFDKNDIHVSKEFYFRSLVHLSLVRLDLDLDGDLEKRIFSTLLELKKAKKF
jgi:thiopeptide-type bacteriocin biosynthesis protein